MSAQPKRVKAGSARGKAPLVCRNIGLASALLRVLGNPTRLAIVCLLTEGERPVMELEAVLGIGQPTLSQQLTALRVAGLIVGLRRARTVVYRLSDDRALRVVVVLREMFAELLPVSVRREEALARLAEREMM